jgi:CRISPR-associated protein Cmr3
MHLFIEPVDVWLFRDGRPFEAGSDHRAESLFPPYPSVMQGVLRSHHLVVKNVDLQNKKAIENSVGTATNFKGLRMRGPFLARREAGGIVRYFPVPADATRKADQLKPLVPRESPKDVLCNVPTPFLLWPEAEPEKGEVGVWLNEKDLHDYFSRQSVSPIPSEKLFVRENRFGIGRDDAKRTTKEGALYDVEFIRPQKDVGLVVEVEGLDGWPERGLMRIGGEGRGGYFEQIPGHPWLRAPNLLPQRFRVYFATPTYFQEGWQPKDWGQFFEGQVTLQAAAIGRYQSLGGFDWARGAHKPAQRYVPAGSVYFFQCRGEARLRTDLVQQAITDFGAEIGFGQIIIKEW